MTITTSPAATRTATISGLRPINRTRAAAQARQDLAYALSLQGMPQREIMERVGFNDPSSVSCAVRRGRERALNNEGRISTRRFGVEIEFTGTTRQRVLDQLALMETTVQAGIMGYTHRVTTGWKLITDVSVTSAAGEGNGLEAVSPILQGEDGFKQVADMMAAITAAGGKVDRTCGLHVHHDANDMAPEAVARLVEFYSRNQQVIDGLVSPSRRSSTMNRWCRGLTERETVLISEAVKTGNRQAVAPTRFDRYRTLNITAYAKYGTVEFRQHQGTLNSRKLTAWAKLGQAMADAAVREAGPAPVFTSVPEMLDYLRVTGGLPATVASYLTERAEDLSDS